MSIDRKSSRLGGWDYGEDGAYFITICALNRKHIFGNVLDGKVTFSRLGHLVNRSLRRVPQFYEHVWLDQYAVMPNHMHAILVFERRGTINRAPTREEFGKPVAGSLATIVRNFKAGVTRDWRREIGDESVIVWQRSYHERIIRNDRELNSLRRYIRNNPMNWQLDRYYKQESRRKWSE